MVDTQAIRKRIATLANGSGNQIIPEMEKKIHDVESFVDSLPEIKKILRADVQFSLKQLHIFLKNADSIASPIDTLSRQVNALGNKPGIKRYYLLQEKIQHTESLRERAAMNREIQQYKSLHGTEISKIVSLEQQTLVHRLNLINCWKSLVITEIGILDELKNVIIKNVLAEAQESDDPEVLQLVQEKIDSIKNAYSEVSTTLSDKSDFHLGNIKILKESMKNQLTKVVQIEMAVEERQETFSCLADLAKDFKSDVETASDEFQNKTAPTPPPPPVEEPETKPSPETDDSTGMAYQSQKR